MIVMCFFCAISVNVPVEAAELSGTATLNGAAEPAADYDRSHDAEIVAQIETLAEEIVVTGFGITTENLQRVLENLLYANPQIFYVGREYSYKHIDGNITKIYFAYTNTAEEIAKQQAELADVVAEVGERLDLQHMTQEEIALSIHDYLAVNCAYPYGEIAAGTAPETAYTIYGALVEGNAACQGYALAYKYLLEQYKMTSGIAVSEAANHVWNIVKIKDSWYHLDVTWDDPFPDNLGRAEHTCFLLSENTLLSKEPKRADYYVVSPYEESCGGATDADFEQGFWAETQAALGYYQGNWYLADADSCRILKCSYDGNGACLETLAEWDEKWPKWSKEGQFFEENYSKLAIVSGILYYSTASDVRRVHLDTGVCEVVGYPPLTGGYVYGLGIYENKLVYAVKQNPQDKETIVVTEIPGTAAQAQPRSILEYKIELEQKSCVYNGKPQTPGFVVKDGGRIVSSSAYTVSWRQNVKTGKARVIVKGKEECGYQGTIEASFKITRASQKIVLKKKKYTCSVGDKPFRLKAKAQTKLKYTSSNRKVVRVGKRGKVTIKGSGRAIIKIEAVRSRNYKKAVKKVVIRVRA